MDSENAEFIHACDLITKDFSLNPIAFTNSGSRCIVDHQIPENIETACLDPGTKLPLHKLVPKITSTDENEEKLEPPVSNVPTIINSSTAPKNISFDLIRQFIKHDKTFEKPAKWCLNEIFLYCRPIYRFKYKEFFEMVPKLVYKTTRTRRDKFAEWEAVCKFEFAKSEPFQTNLHYETIVAGLRGEKGLTKAKAEETAAAAMFRHIIKALLES